MAVITNDGKVKATWVTSISNIAAPTVAELTGGGATVLESDITPDGLNVKHDTGSVDVGNVAVKFTLEVPGRTKVGLSLTLHHRSGTDTIFDLLTRDTDGFLVIRRGVLSTTAYSAGQKVRVYPCRCGEYDDPEPKPDSVWDFMVPMYLTAEPNLRAVVA